LIQPSWPKTWPAAARPRAELRLRLFPEPADVPLRIYEGRDCSDARYRRLRQRHLRAELRGLLDRRVDARYIDIVHPGLRRVLPLHHGTVNARTIRACLAKPVFRTRHGGLLEFPAE